MKVIFQINKNIILLILVCSCSINQEVSFIDKTSAKELNRCVLHQKKVYLSTNNFSPYDSIYNQFIKSDYKIDILHRRLGQRSKISRYIFDENSQSSKYFTNSGVFFFEKEGLNISSNFVPQSSGEYLFACNVGVSDQSTNIYIIKYKGNTIYKFYFREGDFWDLSDTDIDSYNELKKLFSLTVPAGTTDDY